jgi:thioredoxin reductase (NADPH)
MVYDVVVVGAGPAGLATGLAAGRRGLDVLLFERGSIGGELVNRHAIDDFPGDPGVSGPELRSRLVEQLETHEVPIAGTTVEAVHDEDPFRVVTADGEFHGRAVVAAGGGEPTPLDVPGAETYRGRGVFYCATCDGPLYADGTVAVAGSDDWALTDALFLADHASRVVVLAAGDRPSAVQSLRDRVAADPTIEVETRTEVRSVDGDDVLRTLDLVDTESGSERTRAVDGLYVQQGIDLEAGYLPDCVGRTDRDAVAVGPGLETDVDGLFAAGDLRQSSPRTVAAALGDGVTVCRSASRHIESNG